MLLMKLPKWSMFNYRTQLNEFTYIVYICIMFFHWFFPHKFPPQTACSFCNLQVQVPSCRNLLPPHWPPHRDPWPSACCFPPRRTWPALAMWKTWTQKNVFCLCEQKSIPPNLFSQFFLLTRMLLQASLWQNNAKHSKRCYAGIANISILGYVICAKKCKSQMGESSWVRVSVCPFVYLCMHAQM